MSEHVGVIRDADGLRTALREILAIEREARTAALRNMARTALIVAASAFARRESRGGHYAFRFSAPILRSRTVRALPWRGTLGRRAALRALSLTGPFTWTRS